MKNFSSNKNNKSKKAFSLTENLTVLIVLSVIILITIPHVVKDRKLKNDRIALRKAITSYHSILKKEFILSTGLTNAETFANKINNNNCAKIRSEFNISGYTNCEFTTIDGIKWDLSNPQKAIVALKGGVLSSQNAQDKNNLKVFYITFDIDSNKRDLKILTPSDEVNIAKTLNFVTND